jgi:hypothetical protein
MSRTLIAVALVFLLGHSAESQSAIKGRVTDSEGAAITKARVFIHCDPSSRTAGVTPDETRDVIAVTDSSGVQGVPAKP